MINTQRKNGTTGDKKINPKKRNTKKEQIKNGNN